MKRNRWDFWNFLAKTKSCENHILSLCLWFKNKYFLLIFKSIYYIWVYQE
jgi:hypothetical protein